MSRLHRFALATIALLAPFAALAAEPSAPATPATTPGAPEAASAQTQPAPAPPPEPIGLADFARHPYATLPALSPDGSQLAIVYRTDGRRAVAVRATEAEENAKPRVLGALRYTPRWTRWTKNGRILLSLERYQPRTLMETRVRPPEQPRPIYGYDPVLRRTVIIAYEIPTQPPRKEIPAGRVVNLLSFKAEGGRGRLLAKRWPDPVPIQDDVLSWLPADPKRILLGLDEAEQHSSQRVVRPSAEAMSVATGTIHTVIKPNRRVQRWLADHAGEIRLAEGSARDGSTILFRHEGKGKLVEVSTYVNALEASVRFAAYSYDPDLIYAWAPVRGRQALVTLRLSDSTVDGVFAHPQYDVTGPLVFDETARKLIGVGYVDDTPQLHALDASLAKERELMQKAVPGVVLEYVSESENKQLVLVRASSDVRPPAYYVFERPKKQLRLEIVEYPRLEGEPLAAMEPVRFFARDGLEIPAYLTRPLAGPNNTGTPAKAPAIVLVHDGPDQRASRRFDPLVQWLARRGFAVLEPNFRGSAGYGDAHRSLGLGAWGGAMQDDLEDAAAWLVSQGIADAKRIGIYGRGYGGYASLMALARAGTPFRSAASYGGPTDLVELLEDDERARVDVDWSQRVMGAHRLKKPQLVARSPLSQIAALAGPVLLLHSEHDERVRIEQSERFVKAARKLGKAVELVTFEGELHELASEPNRLLWFEKLTAFFERSLAEEIPIPAAPTAATETKP